MKYAPPFLLIVFIIISLAACDEETINDLLNSQDTTLTEDEVAEGLKTALKVSTDTSVSIVSAVDGFYKDEIIKILLPPEADVIVDNKDHVLLKSIGVSALIDDMVLKLNRSAEDASKEATQIFYNAIADMTISDAFDILYGEDSAATNYLRVNTSEDLKTAFKPKIAQSLNKPLVAGVSTNETWGTLTTEYNKVANTTAGKLAGLSPVNTQLEGYVTWKALEGLFYKLYLEEQDIRKDANARVNDILEKVFSELDG